MKSTQRPIHYPVRRPWADQYLIFFLLSFALSVSVTRLFLSLTGYPKLGGGDIHIAHLLWGGLLLLAAVLLLLIFANHWICRLAAILAGVGMGLFMDELGKFVTQNNDYFYPPAAPIVYAFFLICVLVYLQVRRPPARHALTELYSALELVEAVLERDLDAVEWANVEARLNYVIEQKDQPDLAQLAEELLHYVGGRQLPSAPAPPGWWKTHQDRLRDWRKRNLNQRRERTILAAGMGILGLVSAIYSAIVLLSNMVPGFIESVFIFKIAGIGTVGYNYTLWFVDLLIIDGVIGVVLMVGAVLLVIRREHWGLSLGYAALLTDLTLVDLMMFYYYQFRTIIPVAIHFVLLLAVSNYRKNYFPLFSIRHTHLKIRPHKPPDAPDGN